MREVGRRQRLSFAPSWLGAKFDLAYELQQVTAETPPTSGQVVQQAREILELISAHGLRPVLVLDDTDKWLNTSWQDDADKVRGAFFGRVVRVLADDLAATAAVAVHTSYLSDPDYQAAQGFLDSTIHVPAVPDAAAVGKIFARRAALGLGLPEGREATVLNDLMTTDAVDAWYEHYVRMSHNLRRHILFVAHTALTLACDTGAEVLGAAHIEMAIDEADNG